MVRLIFSENTRLLLALTASINIAYICNINNGSQHEILLVLCYSSAALLVQELVNEIKPK